MLFNPGFPIGSSQSFGVAPGIPVAQPLSQPGVLPSFGGQASQTPIAGSFNAPNVQMLGLLNMMLQMMTQMVNARQSAPVQPQAQSFSSPAPIGTPLAQTFAPFSQGQAFAPVAPQTAMSQVSAPTSAQVAAQAPVPAPAASTVQNSGVPASNVSTSAPTTTQNAGQNSATNTTPAAGNAESAPQFKGKGTKDDPLIFDGENFPINPNDYKSGDPVPEYVSYKGDLFKLSTAMKYDEFFEKHGQKGVDALDLDYSKETAADKQLLRYRRQTGSGNNNLYVIGDGTSAEADTSSANAGSSGGAASKSAPAGDRSTGATPAATSAPSTANAGSATSAVPVASPLVNTVNTGVPTSVTPFTNSLAVANAGSAMNQLPFAGLPAGFPAASSNLIAPMLGLASPYSMGYPGVPYMTAAYPYANTGMAYNPAPMACPPPVPYCPPPVPPCPPPAHYCPPTNTGANVAPAGQPSNGQPSKDPFDDNLPENETFPSKAKNKVRTALASPLVFDLNGDGIKAGQSTRSFDIDGDGKVDKISTLGQDDATLVFDADGDGKFGENGKELFGNNTDLDGDGKADGFANGFEALKAFAEKKLGKQAVADGKLDAREIAQLEKAGLKLQVGGQDKSLSVAGVDGISLGFAESDETDAFGNAFAQQGRFSKNGKTQDLVDVWYKKQ